MAVAPTAETLGSLSTLGGLDTGSGPAPSLTSLVDVMNNAGVSTTATPAAGTPTPKAKAKAKAKAVPQGPKTGKEKRDGARS